MSTYQVLIERGNKRGTITRPAGSDGYPPPPGTVVPWVLSQPTQDNLKQKYLLGWEHLGDLGNIEHLKLHGDHTPWSASKLRGIVYADDTKDPGWLEEQLASLCGIDSYDTSWIDFYNINYRQYDYTGRVITSSYDSHLHISVKLNSELVSHTLLLDADRRYRGLPLLNGKDWTMMDINPEQNIEFSETSWVLNHPSFKDRPAVINGLKLKTVLPESWAFGEEMVKRVAPQILGMLTVLVARSTNSSLEQVQATFRAELERAANSERIERQSEWQSYAEQLTNRVTERLGPDFGKVVAEEFTSILQRGTTIQE